MNNHRGKDTYLRIKKKIPSFIKRPIQKIRVSFRRLMFSVRKRYIATHIERLHSDFLARYSGKTPVSVVFIASNFASWKVDSVLSSMMASDHFQVSCIIARLVTGSGAAVAFHEREKLISHFDQKGYPYIDTFEMSDDDIRQLLKRLSPHVVFITNPHALIKPVLHNEIYKNYLTCYVPYHHEVVSYGDNREQYDQISHNAFWKIYAPHQTSKDSYKSIRLRGDRGVEVTGLPACESLYQQPPECGWHWKDPSGRKLRVIWAPHWILRSDLKLATIYELGDAIRELAEQYKDRIEWVMRPHPFLRPTLMNHPAWGEERTCDFYRFWSESPFTQVEEGDYAELFRSSDAMIHDSGSFLAEYLCVDKPVMYLKTQNTADDYLNDFGKKALSACEIGACKEDIEAFLLSLLSGSDPNKEKRKRFFQDSLGPLYDVPPSSKICSDILQEFRIKD